MSDMMPSLILSATGLLNSLSPNLALALSEGLNADCELALEAYRGRAGRRHTGAYRRYAVDSLQSE